MPYSFRYKNTAVLPKIRLTTHYLRDLLDMNLQNSGVI